MTWDWTSGTFSYHVQIHAITVRQPRLRLYRKARFREFDGNRHYDVVFLPGLVVAAEPRPAKLKNANRIIVDAERELHQ